MRISVYRKYRIKVYLNARHYIIFDGKKGEIHPHTWEFSLLIGFVGDEFVQFHVFEKAIAEFLSQYQNVTLNEKKPFDSVIPTVENMTDYFSHPMYEIIKKTGGTLLEIEASESPTRSYILRISDDTNDVTEQDQAELLSRAVDQYLDSMTGMGKRNV